MLIDIHEKWTSSAVEYKNYRYRTGTTPSWFPVFEKIIPIK